MSQCSSNYMAYVTRKNAQVFASVALTPAKLSCLSYHSRVAQESSHAKFGFLQKIKDQASFSFVSRGSTPRPTPETSVSFVTVPDFLPQFLPSSCSGLLGVVPHCLPLPATTQKQCLTSYHLESFKIPLYSIPLWFC